MGLKIAVSIIKFMLLRTHPILIIHFYFCFMLNSSLMFFHVLPASLQQTVSQNISCLLQQIMSYMRPLQQYHARLHHAQDKLLMSNSTKLIHSEPEIGVPPLMIQKKQVEVDMLQLQLELKCYEWRTKTELPIVRITEFQTVKIIQEKCLIEVTCEKYPVRLTDLKDIALFRMLYILKETLIGCERLLDKFGPFRLTAGMVCLNQLGKCKVWISEDLCTNSLTSSSSEEATFLQQLFGLFESRSSKLKNSQLFFQQLRFCNSFCISLNFIENYSRENKISIPTCCRPTPKELALPISSDKALDVNYTIMRSPRFLNPLTSVKERKCWKPSMNSTNVKDQAQQHEDNMKTSGDTTADIYASNTISYQNGQYKIDKFFGQSNGRQIVSKSSELSSKTDADKPRGFNRKICSSFEQNQCFTPTYTRKEWGHDDHDFCRDTVEQSGQGPFEPALLMTSIFSKNNWQKTVKGLFNMEELKKSVHHGKQKRSTDNLKELQLLNKLGKNIHQSFINQEVQLGDYQY